MNYTLTLHPSFVTGGPGRNWLLRDNADEIDYRHFETDALVASGDYLQALSSQLETVSMRLERTAPEESVSLEQLITQINHIDRHYYLKRKQK